MSNDLDGLQQWVDLTVYDRAPEELVDRAIADAASKWPDWIPRLGNTEVVLLQAFALVVAELIYAINRIPAAVTEVLLRLFGVERSNGSNPVASVEFTFIDAAGGYSIPAGTHLRLDVDNGTSLIFTTDADAEVDVGETVASVTVTAAEPTDAANGTPIGTVLTILEGAPFVESAELDAPVSAGTPPEDTTTYLNRAVVRFNRLTDTLVKPEHFTAAARDDVRVARATTIDNHDGAAPSNGHVAVAVAGAGGIALSGPVKAEIEAVLDDAAIGNLIVHVIDPTITNVAVTTTVKKLAGFADVDVKNAVVVALQSYLSPDKWAWGALVPHNELIAVIDGAAGVDYVVSLTAPVGDVALAGIAPLATTDVDAGDVTVT